MKGHFRLSGQVLDNHREDSGVHTVIDVGQDPEPGEFSVTVHAEPGSEVERLLARGENVTVILIVEDTP